MWISIYTSTKNKRRLYFHDLSISSGSLLSFVSGNKNDRNPAVKAIAENTIKGSGLYTLAWKNTLNLFTRSTASSYQ